MATIIGFRSMTSRPRPHSAPAVCTRLTHRARGWRTQTMPPPFRRSAVEWLISLMSPRYRRCRPADASVPRVKYPQPTILDWSGNPAEVSGRSGIWSVNQFHPPVGLPTARRDRRAADTARGRPFPAAATASTRPEPGRRDNGRRRCPGHGKAYPSHEFPRPVKRPPRIPRTSCLTFASAVHVQMVRSKSRSPLESRVLPMRQPERSLPRKRHHSIMVRATRPIDALIDRAHHDWAETCFVLGLPSGDQIFMPAHRSGGPYAHWVMPGR